MRSQRVWFDNDEGARLAAVLDRPDNGNPVACALFAHCFTCSKNYKAMVHVSRALADQGVAVLRFDFTGLGESEGEFSNTTFSSNVGDLVSASVFLEAQQRAPEILIGHSLGGAAVIQAAGRIPSTKAVVTIAAPSSTDHLAALLRSKSEELADGEDGEVEIGGRRFSIRSEFVRDLESFSMKTAIAELGRAILIFHSPDDRVVGIEHASRIFDAARHPKSFVSLDGADHLLTDPRDSQVVGSMIAQWARRYVGRA